MPFDSFKVKIIKVAAGKNVIQLHVKEIEPRLANDQRLAMNFHPILYILNVIHKENIFDKLAVMSNQHHVLIPPELKFTQIVGANSRRSRDTSISEQFM